MARASKAELASLANALLNVSTTDEKEHIKVSVISSDGKYTFLFSEHGIEPPADDNYDVDIDLIPGAQKKAVILDLDSEGFEFQVKSSGKHFTPQPVNCSVDSVKASITITFFES